MAGAVPDADGRLRWQPEVGEVVAMRRAHACGGERFVVTAVSLGVRLSCVGCGARLIMERSRLRTTVRAVVGRVSELDAASDSRVDRRHP